MKEWLKEEPFTLCLSVSLFGYWAHFGVIAALLEEGIKPQRIAGSSGGAIAATMYSKGCSVNEMLRLASKFEFSDMLEFRPRTYSEFPYIGLFDVRIDNLKEQLFVREKITKSLNCDEDKCPVSISVHNKRTNKPEVLSTCDAAIAMAASASVPFLINEVIENGDHYIDGGVSDPLGLCSCATDERILSIDLSLMCDRQDTSNYTNMRTIKMRDLPTIFPSMSIVRNGRDAYHHAYNLTKSLINAI